MKALIIDDEQHAIARLSRLLAQIPAVNETVAFSDPVKALEYMKKNKQDIVFLDIEMSVSGLEIFSRITEIEAFVPIVFTTAYDQYAVEAFELNAVDYLLKPFRLARLQKSVDRVIAYYQMLSPDQAKPKELRIECFKRLTVYYDNKIINLNWRTKKADELIAFLLCENGDFVSKDKIIENLWPGSDRKKGLSTLYTTLYYLRHQQQNSQAKIPIESLRRKMRFNTDNVQIDLVEMAEQYKRFQQGLKINKSYIIELYKGMLFEEHDYPWAVILQARYENMYQQMVSCL